MGLIIQDLKSRNIFMGLMAQKEGDKESKPVQDVFFPVIGATRLSIRWTHDIGQRQGLTANFLQPWYNKPVEIQITGQSYIGMYGGSSLEEALASQRADKQREADKQASNKILNKVKSITDVIGKGISSLVDNIKFKTGISNALLTSTVSAYCDSTGISPSDLTEFFKIYSLNGGETIQSLLNRTGKSAIELKAFTEVKSITWKTKNWPAKNNIGLAEVATGFIKDTLKKNLELLKRSLGPKEDHTVDNIKRLISYFDFGPFRKKAGYSKIQHILLIENEAGQNSSDAKTSDSSSFSTFLGYIKDFNYIESVESPFIYEYTIEFVGLPDTGQTIENATINAKTDSARGGITVNVVSGNILLQQGLGLLQQIPKVGIPKIPGL